MRRLIMTLLFVFLVAPALSATGAGPTRPSAVEIVPGVVAGAESAFEADMHLDEITLEERAAPNDAATAQLGPRGGFWWVVGVIVVAGVILALVI